MTVQLDWAIGYEKFLELYVCVTIVFGLLVIHVCGKCVMGYGPGDCLDAGKRVGNEVILTRCVTKVFRKLGNVLQIIQFPWRMLMAYVPSGWWNDGLKLLEEVSLPRRTRASCRRRCIFSDGPSFPVKARSCRIASGISRCRAVPESCLGRWVLISG